MVRSSTFARLILISPAITSPLSKTRSRMSTRPCDRVGFTSSGKQGSNVGRAKQSPQAAQRPEIDVQIVVRQAERRLQLTHALVQLEQCQPQPFDLLVGQRPAVHPPNRLVLQHFA